MKKKKEEIPFGRPGGKCVKCGEKNAIVLSKGKSHVSHGLGDGMAGMTHVGVDIPPPLRCQYCGAPFRAKTFRLFVTVVTQIVIGDGWTRKRRR